MRSRPGSRTKDQPVLKIDPGPQFKIGQPGVEWVGPPPDEAAKAAALEAMDAEARPAGPGRGRGLRRRPDRDGAQGARLRRRQVRAGPGRGRLRDRHPDADLQGQIRRHRQARRGAPGHQGAHAAQVGPAAGPLEARRRVSSQQDRRARAAPERHGNLPQRRGVGDAARPGARPTAPARWSSISSTAIRSACSWARAIPPRKASASTARSASTTGWAWPTPCP